MDLGLERLLVLIFGSLVVDVLLQVGARYFAGISFSFTEEYARFSLIWLSLLGGAYLNGRREHLSMDFLYQKLSVTKKVKALRVIEGLIGLFALVVLVIGGGNLVYITLHLGQISPALHIPLGYVYAVVPLTGILILLYSIYNITNAKNLVGSHQKNIGHEH